VTNSTPDQFGITPEARALAKAIIDDNDPAAVLALADWVAEQTNGRPVGRFSIAYVEKLEDTLLECRKVVRRVLSEYEDDSPIGQLTPQLIYLRDEIFKCEQMAKTVGREGPA